MRKHLLFMHVCGRIKRDCYNEVEATKHQRRCLSMSVNFRKVAVVGCGFVGSSSAFALMESGMFSEMVLIDVMKEKAEGEAMDIGHGTALTSPMNIYAGDYADAKDAAIIVVTAGAAQKPGETRLDLIKKNIGIFAGIMPQIKEQHCEGIMLVVANPVDVLTYYAIKTFRHAGGQSIWFRNGIGYRTSPLSDWYKDDRSIRSLFTPM
jgi:hypothetical protein